jgi:hypothetical protein
MSRSGCGWVRQHQCLTSKRGPVKGIMVPSDKAKADQERKGTGKMWSWPRWWVPLKCGIDHQGGQWKPKMLIYEWLFAVAALVVVCYHGCCCCWGCDSCGRILLLLLSSFVHCHQQSIPPFFDRSPTPFHADRTAADPYTCVNGGLSWPQQVVRLLVVASAAGGQTIHHRRPGCWFSSAQPVQNKNCAGSNVVLGSRIGRLKSDESLGSSFSSNSTRMFIVLLVVRLESWLVVRL